MTMIPFSLAGTVTALSEIGNELPPGKAVLVRRDGQPRWLVMACPCECGEEIRVNLDRRSGPAWRIYTSEAGALSVYPSVWRDSGCGSHFIIWNDRLFLFGRYTNDDEEASWGHQRRTALVSLVRARVGREPVYFVELADELGQVPWDVLDALRGLAKLGEVEEGRGHLYGWFNQRLA